MTTQEFEARIIDWARRQTDVEALIQIGSRVQSGAEVDDWSDWDYILISTHPQRYHQPAWLSAIAQPWCAHAEMTPRGVVKVSAVFPGGREADFVVLAAWQMKLVYWAMARPWTRHFMKSALLRGIAQARLFVGPGYRVIHGGSAWVRRLSALDVPWPAMDFKVADFQSLLSGFWRHAVWVQKKIMRGENRAALRWLQIEVTERRQLLLAEEARLAGRPVRAEARKAEKWLDERRLIQTSIEIRPDQQVLARALLAEVDLFEQLSLSVANSREFALPDYSAVSTWLRTELAKITDAA